MREKTQGDPLSIKCLICNAKPGERCGSLLDSVYLEEPHAGRRQAIAELFTKPDGDSK